MTKELNIGIVGLGTVGSGVIKSIEKNRDYFKNNYDVVFNILGISANSKSKERSFNVSNYKWFDNPLDIINEKNIDTVIELIGGEDGLAYDLAINSLKNNKNFITANKALISKHGEELSILTEKHKSFFGFEASVAGGIPIIKTLKESIILNEIQIDGFEDDIKWGLSHTINDQEFTTYCTVDGYDCESTELNNITINERDGYHCYVKD